jgi:hypothetical protein
MKKGLFIAVSLGVFAAPAAQAQLLGGAGLGGQLGGTLSGVRSLPDESLRSVTRGSVRTDARTSGSQRVDRRRGAVEIDRSLEGSGEGVIAQAIDTPFGTGAMEGSGKGSASGSGSARAQLVGTDQLRSATDGAMGRAREARAAVTERVSEAKRSALGLSGSARGSGTASGQGSTSSPAGFLAASGSGAAAGDGAFAVAPGMPVLSPDGERLGKVRQIVSDSRGRVESVLVRAQGHDVTVPAATLTGSGRALVMSEGALAAHKSGQPGQATESAEPTPRDEASSSRDRQR